MRCNSCEKPLTVFSTKLQAERKTNEIYCQECSEGGSESLQEAWLEKMRADVIDGTYDLLVEHAKNWEHRIDKNDPDQHAAIEQYVNILLSAIEKMRTTNPYTESQYRRLTILLCNLILRLDKENEQAKKRKKTIIAEFTQSEKDDSEFIPLNNQVTELRITHDSRYLKYRVQRLIKQQMWWEALYMITAVRILEPDWEDLKAHYEIIKQHLPDGEPADQAPSAPDGMLVLLDTNAVLQRIMDDRRAKELNNAIMKYGNRKYRFIITTLAQQEIEEHVQFIVQAKKYHGQKRRDIQNALKKQIDKYGFDKEIPCDITPIQKFYRQYPSLLEQIFFSKVSFKSRDDALKRLAKRHRMLPETGDMEILAQATTLAKVLDRPVGIITQDADFTAFSNEIYRELGVYILPV